MRIKITAGFCSIVCLLGWIDLPLCGYFLVGILVHELGHLLALKLCRIPVTGVELRFCGAVIQTEWMDYGREFGCAAAGPVAGLMLGIVTLYSVPKLAMASLGLAAFNLLPLYPMDGGRMLRALLLLLCREERAEKVLNWVTIGTCLSLMVLACWGTVYLQAGVWPIFVSLALLWRAGGKEKQLLFSGIEDKMKEQE